MREIKPWTEVVRLHPDVESEETAIATYAIDLGALVAKDPSVPPTYRDAYSFFRATHLTSDMRMLIKEVYDRLSGKAGNRVLQLRSPFGGGKSHTLATLYYAVKNRKEMEKSIQEISNLPEVKDVRVAVFDGEKFDAISGTEIDGKRIRTLWGFLAWQLNAYELIEEQDQKRVAPGGEFIKKIIEDKPTLILLDEVSRYLERSMGEKVEETTLYRQTMDFIQTLTTEVSSSKNACLIYSLQASEREFFGNVEILSTLDHLASRVDAKREPIRGDEIFSVLRKRLLAEQPPEDIANKVADNYKELVSKCLYIHFDGARYAFKTTPNVNKLLEDGAEGIGDDEIRGEIKRLLEVELGGKPAIIWPNSSKDIPDREPVFRIAYLPFEFVYRKEETQKKLGKEFLTQLGDRPRVYKNGIALAIPDKNHIESLRRAVRYLITIERLKAKKKSLNLTEIQLEQLKEREKTEKASRDSSLRSIYNTIWLLKMQNGAPCLEVINIGGRVLQATNIHERLMELLMRVPPPKVFDSLTAKKLLDLIKIKEGVKTKDIVDTFFSSPDFPRITDENVIKKAISKGIKDGLFGITNEDKVQIVKDKPVVARKYVTIGKEVPEEEIALSSGYIVSAEIISIKEEPEPTPPQEEKPEEPEKPKEGKINQVIYTFKLNRQQLFKCFNALGNLAERSGEISLRVEAYPKESIDVNWLKNAVEEPIEEAGVEIKKEK